MKRKTTFRLLVAALLACLTLVLFNRFEICSARHDTRSSASQANETDRELGSLGEARDLGLNQANDVGMTNDADSNQPEIDLFTPSTDESRLVTEVGGLRDLLRQLSHRYAADSQSPSADSGATLVPVRDMMTDSWLQEELLAQLDGLIECGQLIRELDPGLPTSIELMTEIRVRDGTANSGVGVPEVYSIAAPHIDLDSAACFVESLETMILPPPSAGEPGEYAIRTRFRLRLADRDLGPLDVTPGDAG